MKICQTCKHSDVEFGKSSWHGDGLKPSCKGCRNKKGRDYKKQNRDTVNAYARRYRLTEKRQAFINKYMKLYRRKHRSKLLEQQKRYQNNRVKTDIEYHIRKNLRGRLSNAVKHGHKKGSAVKDLGCSISEFKLYLESKFVMGMTWNNYGRTNGCWQIDHILPLTKFDLTDREQLLRACHYTNLQPLWKIDNIKKGNKIEISAIL